MDVVLAHASADGPDESFLHLVERVDVAAEIKARCLGLVEGYHAADPARISVRSLLKNTAADERPGANRQFRFVGGYDGLVAAIFQRIDPGLVRGAAQHRGHCRQLGTPARRRSDLRG